MLAASFDCPASVGRQRQSHPAVDVTSPLLIKMATNLSSHVILRRRLWSKKSKLKNDHSKRDGTVNREHGPSFYLQAQAWFYPESVSVSPSPLNPPLRLQPQPHSQQRLADCFETDLRRLPRLRDAFRVAGAPAPRLHADARLV